MNIVNVNVIINGGNFIMNKKEYSNLQDGDIVENISSKRKYVVKVEDTETIPKLRLMNYQDEFKVVSKVRRDNLE
jgi:hypothetical protein